MGQRVTAVLFLFFFFSLPLFSQKDPIYLHGLYSLPFFPDTDLTGKSRRTLGERGGIHLRFSWDVEKLSTTLGQVEGLESYSGEGERSLPGRVELLAGSSRGGLLLTLGRALPLYKTSLKAWVPRRKEQRGRARPRERFSSSPLLPHRFLRHSPTWKTLQENSLLYPWEPR